MGVSYSEGEWGAAHIEKKQKGNLGPGALKREDCGKRAA